MLEVDFPDVRQLVRARSAVEALTMCSFKVGDERVVDGVRYVLQLVDVVRDTSILKSSYNHYIVTGAFRAVEHRHPRLWGVTHV